MLINYGQCQMVRGKTMDNLDEIPAAVAVEVPVRTRRTRRTREPSTVTASTVSSRLKRRKMRE